MTIQVSDLALLFPVMARIASALMTGPIFSHRSVPAVARIALAGLLAWLLLAPGGISADPPASTLAWLGGLAGEVLIGLLLGFLSSLAFWAVSMAGEIVGMQMGWGFPGMLHASLESSPAATGQFYLIMGTLIFLCTGGHHLWLMGLAGTFTAAPPFALTQEPFHLEQVLSLAASLFVGAVQLALPVVGTLMFVEVALAFLTRIMPQLNAWIFGMPVKVGVGLLAIWLTLPVLVALLSRWLMQAPNAMRIVVH